MVRFSPTLFYILLLLVSSYIYFKFFGTSEAASYFVDVLFLVKFWIGEIMNLRNLERVLAREEEVKKRAIAHKAVYSGPQIRYSSKNGKLSPFMS